MADIPNDISTTATISGSGSTLVNLEVHRDSDWYRTRLTEGYTYGLVVVENGEDTPEHKAWLRIHDENGNILSAVINNFQVSLTAKYTGTYYIEVHDLDYFDDAAEGDFLLKTEFSDIVRNDIKTTASILDGHTISGRIDAKDDFDWYQFNAVAGRTYTVTMTSGSGSDGVPSQRVALMDAGGQIIKTDTRSPHETLTWTATSSGTFYINAGSRLYSNETGSFNLSVVSDSVTLRGTSGNDRITGGSISNVMSGLDGHDSLSGGAGNDVLIGGRGNDVLNGGSGTDTVRFDTSGSVQVNLGQSSAQNTGEGRDTLLSIENVISGTGNDRLVGSGSTNRLDGGNGNDLLRGQGGSDVLINGAGNDTIDGGRGGDTIVFSGSARAIVDLASSRVQNTGYGLDLITSVENATGGSGADRLTGRAGGNVLDGGAGNDLLNGRAGNDVLRGGNDADRLMGGLGNDLLDGGSGDDAAIFTLNRAISVDLTRTTAQNTGEGMDRLIGIERIVTAGGNDRLCGDGNANVLKSGAGNDLLQGRDGNDRLVAGGGNDRLYGGRGNDVLDGGSGSDTAVFTLHRAIKVDLMRTTAQNTGDGVDRLIGIERVSTAGGNDRLLGNEKANVLSSAAGNDLLLGRAGNDRLLGGSGVDRLNGGRGDDVMSGGSGADRFIFRAGDGRDRIVDFQNGIDHIVIGGRTDFDDLQITDTSAGTRIAFSGTTIVLDKVNVGSIDEDDFLFT